MGSQRVEWVDTLKGFGIFLVFLGHTTLISKEIDHYIFSFHMPLFFFVSGIFYKGSDAYSDLREFLLIRLNTRIVPYFSFGILTYFIWVVPILMRKYGIYQGTYPVPDSLFIKPFLGMFYGIGDSEWLPHNGMLWFLACLFIVEVIFYLINSFFRTWRPLLVVLLVFALIGYLDSVYFSYRVPFSADIALTAVVLYGLGYLTKDYLLRSDANILYAFICLLLGMAIGFINDRVDMNSNIYGNPILFYTSSLLSIYAYISFAKRIPGNRFVNYVGANSLVFFLLQNIGFLVINVLVFLAMHIRPHTVEPNIIFACCYVLLSMLVLFPAVHLIRQKAPIMIRGFKSARYGRA